jgi:septal ring factor EnvC (AmiA/AmiB activator)
MYCRARYAREYVVYQHNLSGQVLQKQAELLKAQNRLLEAKSRKSAKLNEIMEQRKSLNEQQMQEKERVAGLKKKESGLKGKVAEQQKQIAALDRKIEEVIAYEIEQARKKAEEEAQKKKAAAKKTTTTKTKQPASTSKPKTETKPATTQKSGSWLTAADRQLNGTFEQNKGRLPVPITGQYMLGNRFGIYNVPGMKNVQLDNKGTDYVGRPGARARAIFDGVVTSVFQFSGTRNVLVRHGSYISVYCNLSSTIVQKGQKVRARDILGTVANDGSGNCTLHFQLRKETTKLNPEAWIGR